MTYAETYAAIAALVSADATFTVRVETWRYTYEDGDASRVSTDWHASVFGGTGRSIVATATGDSPESMLAALRVRLGAESIGLDAIGDAVIAADESEAAE